MRRLPHMLIGASAGLAAARLTGAPDYALSAAAAAIAATLPDIDLHWSRLTPRARAGAPAGLLEHRGPTHSLLAAGLLYFGLVAAGLGPLALGAAAGYASHLLADGISYMGVPYFWPVAARIRLLPYGFRIEAGSPLDLPLALLVALAVGYWVVGPLPAYAEEISAAAATATAHARDELANACAQHKPECPTATATPTPSQTPTPTATATPTPTPTPEPSPTPATLVPCFTDEAGVRWLVLDGAPYFDESGEPVPCPPELEPGYVAPQQEEPAPFVEPPLFPEPTPTASPTPTPVVQIVREVVREIVYVQQPAPQVAAAAPATIEPLPVWTETPTPTATSTASPTMTPTATTTATATVTSTPTASPTVVMLPTAAPTPTPPAEVTRETPRPHAPVAPVFWRPQALVTDRKMWPRVAREVLLPTRFTGIAPRRGPFAPAPAGATGWA